MADNGGMNSKLRAWWWTEQGLDGSLDGKTPREALMRSGWSRSVGGASPYIGIFARTGASMAVIDKAVADAEIHELPAARGCTYVLPKDDYAVGLSAARGFSDDSEITQAKRFLGVTDAEIDALCDAVVNAVEKTPLDPKDIKTAVDDKARSLGEEGKKRGTGSTLPLALGRLQVSGLIRRIPAEGRLDRQRYKYVAWKPSPMEGYSRTNEEALADLAELYWRWAGPASVSHFQKFAGIGVKAAKDVVAPLDYEPIEAGSDLLLPPGEIALFEAFEAPGEPHFNLVGSLDGVLLHRWELAPLLDDADKDRETATDKALAPIAFSRDLYSNAILDRGRLVGLWEYDPFEKEIISVSFVKRTPALKSAIEKTEAFVRDQLEDCRSFSLDSPESRKPKLASAARAPRQKNRCSLPVW